jgi:hypothetical protein
MLDLHIRRVRGEPRDVRHWVGIPPFDDKESVTSYYFQVSDSAPKAILDDEAARKAKAEGRERMLVVVHTPLSTSLILSSSYYGSRAAP